jgi:hypothetical protein
MSQVSNSFFNPFEDSNPGALPSVSSPSRVDTADLSIIPDEEEDRPGDGHPDLPPFQPFPFGGNAPSFNFTFDEVPQPNGPDSSGFVFDLNEQPTERSEEEQLFAKLRELLNDPCFEANGPSVTELFKQEDETESIDAAYRILLGDAPFAQSSGE